MNDILKTIVAARRKNFSKEQKQISEALPREREVQLVPFFTERKNIICEFKRGSPSKGDFILNQSYETIMKDYLRGSVKHFSVVTERNYFNGSLKDLIQLKNLYPDKAFLRKDFLFCKEDIHISYLAGADAVLLIAEALDTQTLEELMWLAKEYRMQVLCEVHSRKALAKVLSLNVLPTAIGINSRDLKTFQVDPSVPFRLRPFIPRNIKAVYESGVSEPFLNRLIGNAGFDAVLVGESVVKDAERVRLIKNFVNEFNRGAQEIPNYFTKLYNLKRDIIVKICGITNIEDAWRAYSLGADVLGFVLTSSPRKTDLKFIASLSKLNVLKVVVVGDIGKDKLTELSALIKQGVIDGVQFHCCKTPEVVHAFGGNAYRAIVLKSLADFKHEKFIPQVLYDASKTVAKTKGKLIPANLRKHLQGGWIAGGLNPGNIKKLISQIKPQLVDVSSGVEKEPGKKDEAKLERFIQGVRNAKVFW